MPDTLLMTTKDPYLTALRTSACIPNHTDRAGAIDTNNQKLP